LGSASGKYWIVGRKTGTFAEGHNLKTVES
jgi:hypothetical protein